MTSLIEDLLLRVATGIAVSAVAVTDVEAAGVAVEPDSRDAVAVVAAVAAGGGEVNPVGPAAVHVRAGDHVEADGEVSRHVDDSEDAVLVEGALLGTDDLDDTADVQVVAVAVLAHIRDTA